MKKIMAIVLVAAMVMAIMPAAFATSAVKAPEKINAADKKFESNASVSGETLQFGRTTHGGQTTINPQSIDKKYQTMDKTKSWMDDIELSGIGIIEPADAASSGYWMTEDREDWTLVAENPAFDSDAYGMCLVPATEEGAYTYAKGELMWFNFDLYQSFNTSTGELTSLTERKDGYGVSTWIYAGHLNDESYPLIGAWSSAQGGLSINLTAPDDDYVYMIYIFVEKVDEFADGWGGWFTLSTSDIVVRDAAKGADMKVGETLTETISTSGKLIAAPINEAYVPEYGQVHKIELEGNTKYVLNHTSDGTVYVHLMFFNENMDVIAEMAAIDDGQHNAMKVFPTESGTYYVAAFGLTMEDEGEVNLEVVELNDYVEEAWPEIDVTIDASEFGSEEIQGKVGDILVWDYYDGVLQVGGLPGNYTLKGDATGVVIVAYDGARLIMDNAKAAAVLACNSYAPISIEAKGEAVLDNPQGYGMLNEEGYLAGVYVVGDTFKVENCVFGIVLEGSPITLAAKKTVVDTTSMDGYYPIAMWVMGINLPGVGLGKNAKFDGSNRVTKLSYDPDGNFTYGYAISEHEELYRANQEGFGWDEGVLYFELTTDGMGPVTVAGMVGDANGDGKVNTGDATQVLKYAAGMITLEGEQLANADTNGDGKVNTGDATMILKYAAGMISEFPVH